VSEQHDGPIIVCQPIFGYVSVKSWFKPRHDETGFCLVGMGSATTYDNDGCIVNYRESETGLVVRL
jgi:hypothetical protein